MDSAVLSGIFREPHTPKICCIEVSFSTTGKQREVLALEQKAKGSNPFGRTHFQHNR